MDTHSISRRLSRWVARLSYADIPPEVLDRARGVTLQGLSSCLLGYGFAETKQAIRLVEEEEQGSTGKTTVLVDGRTFSRAGAAFINSEMMFAGGKWDTFRMVTHPGCAILPAALMAAEATHCSGREFLTGIVAGYEVMERLAADFVPTIMARGFHVGPVFSIFGAATAIAKIMGSSAEHVHGALAQCVNLASGNLEGIRSGGRSTREGAAVRNAMLAVGLARQGVPGGETVFEGEAGFYFAYAGNKEGRLTHSFTGARTAEFGAITERLGERWVFLETLYRIYSTAGYNIAHVDVTAALCKRDNIRPEQVERVECLVN
jgi:2-methylcitrate dehydratase PrpD